MSKLKKHSKLFFAKEWMKACRNAIKDGTLSIEDYVLMINKRIKNLK